MEISYISTKKLIEKGVANHAFKAHEFSHFLPYSDLVQYQFPFEREGKFILPNFFAYDNVSINVSDSEYEAKDQVESVLTIGDEVHSNLDPVPTPNPRPKWAQNGIEVIGNMNGESSDKRRTRSQFQNESLALCQANPLLVVRRYNLP